MQRRPQRFLNALFGLARGLQVHRAISIFAAIGEFFPNGRRRIHDRRIVRERHRRLLNFVQRIEVIRPACRPRYLHQIIVPTNFAGNESDDRRHADRVDFRERAGHFQGFVEAALVDQRIEAVDELLLFLAIAGHAIVEQSPFAGGGEFFFALRIQLIFDDGSVLGLAQGDLQFILELARTSGVSSGARSTFCSDSLRSCIAVCGSFAHGFASVDHGVLDFAPQHLAEHAALLLNFVKQGAVSRESIG